MSGGATARLFVAIDPPLRVREELAEWALGVAVGSRASGASRSALRLLDVSLLHLTLCFLGSRPVAEIDALAEGVRSCHERACELSLGAPLWLPPRRPRALAVEVHDRDRALTGMQERVSRSLSALSGWEASRGRFRPHITIARVRWGAKGGSGRTLLDRAGHEHPMPATPRIGFAPEAVVLYRSWLSPEGASYQVLASCELQPA
jgi:RNA 2',3'-cyclic 3'-phosphodiesterase